MNHTENDVGSGKISLKDGYVFYWMAARDGEISGFVEGPHGGIVPKTSGWYRTEDPEKAARYAETVYLS